MARISCHEPAFFLSEVPLGMHQSTILPSPDTGERISRASCRRRTAENASRTCAHTRMHRWMRLRRRSRGASGPRGGCGGRGTAGGTARGARGPRSTITTAVTVSADRAGGAGAAGEGGGVEVRGGISAPSVERGNRRPQACAAAGRDGGRVPSATRVRMYPFTPTFFRCGTVIKIICYATNK